MKKAQISFIQLTAFLIFLAVTKIVYAAYLDMGDGTVYDDEQSLLWQQSDDGVQRYFADAESYCNDLSLGGKENWKLPSVETLSSLVDKNYTPTIAPIFLSQSAEYFSSTTQWAFYSGPSGTIGATVVSLVDFNTGDINKEPIYQVNDMIAIGYTRCVIKGYNPDAKPLTSIMYLLLKPAP